MTKRIIEVKKCDEDLHCLTCCERKADVKISIQRLKYEDNIVAFWVCSECLSKMQKDIEVCE